MTHRNDNIRKQDATQTHKNSLLGYRSKNLKISQKSVILTI